MREFRDLVIFDPAAAGADRDKVREIIADALPAAAFRGLVEGEAIGSDVERAVISGYDRIVVAGGDARIAEVAAAMLYTGFPLGIVPLGPHGATAVSMNLPTDPAEACALLALGGRVRELDVMSVNGSLALTEVAIGRVRLASPDPAPERGARLGLGSSWRFRLVADASVHKLKAACVTVGRAPGAWGRDGRLHVSYYPNGSIFDVFSRKDTVGAPVALLQAAREVVVECHAPIPVRINSEVSKNKRVRIENLPGALRVVMPYASAETPLNWPTGDSPA